MKIGDKVWLFDSNRRVYAKGENSPIYAEYFHQVTIDGETSRSWLIGGRKFNKNNSLDIYTDEQKQDKIWDDMNRYKIIEKIKYCSVDKLKQINLLL